MYSVRDILPIWRLERLRHRWNQFALSFGQKSYECLYEKAARADTSDQAVGGGDFEKIGRIEFDLLLMEGLKPTDTLVDFGCGTGRLAVHVIPRLKGGQYVGIDISETFLKRAAERIQKAVSQPPCEIRFVKQTTPQFPLQDGSVNMICAFSVFTHMEHEDSYQYLKAARQVMRPGGRFIFSCLPMSLEAARTIFLNEAKLNVAERWSRVRNVTTSEDFMTQIAQLAGWRVVRWYRGDEANILRANGERYALGQSSCVLEPATR